MVADVTSGLVWFGASGLAYLIPSLLGSPFVGVEQAVISENTFTVTSSYSTLAYLSPQLRGVQTGFLVQTQDYADFFPTEPVDDVFYDHTLLDSIVSPSGKYLARNSGGALLSYDLDAFENSLHARRPPCEGASPSLCECGVLLAWSEDDQTIACATGAEVRLFNVATNALSMPLRVPLDNYNETQSLQRTRLFSSSSHLALVTDEGLHVVNGGSAGSPRFFRPWTSAPAAGATVDLAFSVNGRFLVQHRGVDLTYYDLTSQLAGGKRLRGTMPLSSSSCTEVYGDAPDSWCGSARPQRAFRVSESGPFVAYVNADAELAIASFLAEEDAERVVLDADCSARCAESLRFQP
jgi:hypothetical protein